jgi:acyl-CoA thioester hydrolase
MLRHLGIEQDKLRAETGLMFVVRRLVAEFLQPARLDDQLAVATQLKHLGGASLDLDQEVRRADHPLVRLALRIACIGQDGKPSRLPDDIVTRFTALNTH